ncbi:MAG: Ig-like domain repeat protein, partial [Thermoplasmatales archaeon]|nr:Ig-like domain repeat protein [Thermoplasmatales archaeon]
DDTDRKPYVDVWLDGKWYLKENYTINRTYYNTTVEITINMSTLSLGDHTLKVRAIDLNGNIGYGWINFTVVDDVAPDSQIDVISTYWHNESVIITAAASDERSNITNVTLYYYNSTDNSTWYGPFKFGSDENTPWNWAFDFPNGEGYYRFYTVAWDEAGNQEIFTVNDTACGYDTTAPMSEVIQISPYWQTTSEFTVTANTDDEMSGISTVMLYYQYSYDNATWSNWTLYAANCNAPWQWLFNTSVLDGDGYYQFYSIATDIAGNIEAAPVVADMCCAVDTGMPISSVTPISPYWQTTAGFTMTANASNGMSGISEVELWYRYSVDNVNWSAWAYFATNSTPTFIDGHNYTVSFAFTSPEGDGYYEFYTIAKDTSGNNESAPTKADVACGVDTTLPSSAVTMISPYWQNTIPFAVTVNASDVTSGIKEAGLYYKYSSDNSSWSSWLLFSSNKTTQPYIWDFTAPDGDGYYQFYSIATDNAGNTQETFTTIIICGVDTVAPTTTDNASVGWQNTTVTVTLTPIDSLSGVAYTEYKLWLDGETEPANWNMGTTVMINSDGIWDIKYRSVDNAGNMETNNTVQVQVDMTVPSTSHELSGAVGDNNWFTTNVTVTLIATDMTSGVNCTKYRVDYGDWMMYDGGFELSTEGSHLVEYYSVDNAGNVEKVTNITVKIDKTPPSTGPTITGTTGENNWYISDVTVNLNSIDATSGVNYTEYKLDGSGWQTYTGNFTVNSDGEHVVNYRSVDNAGNVETYKTVSFKIDQTPPIAESILINNDDDYTNTTTVQLSLNAFDNTSGVWM